MHHVSTGYPTYCREGRILEKLRYVGEYAVTSTLTNVQLGIVETSSAPLLEVCSCSRLLQIFISAW